MEPLKHHFAKTHVNYNNVYLNGSENNNCLIFCKITIKLHNHALTVPLYTNIRFSNSLLAKPYKRHLKHNDICLSTVKT